MPGEMVTLQIGQCGNQVGLRFWELALRELAEHNKKGRYAPPPATPPPGAGDEPPPDPPPNFLQPCRVQLAAKNLYTLRAPPF